MPDKIRPLSKLLIDLENSLTSATVSIDALLETFHERGFGFFLILFALPLGLPIPKPPAFATIMSLPLMLLTLQQVFGFHRVWFPQTIKRRQLDTAMVKKIIDYALPWFAWVEKLMHPRLGFMTQGGWSVFTGAMAHLMSLSVLFPMPGSNMVPCIGITLIAAGLLMRDGLTIIVGIFVGIGWMILFYGLLIYYGMEGVHWLMNEIQSFF